MSRVLRAVIVLAVVGVGGCQPRQTDQVTVVEEALRAKLKDPESVRFQNVRVVNGRVCGEYNAKNSFGGYVGFEPFYGRVTDNGRAEVYTPSDNPFGGEFEKLLDAACADRSLIPLDDQQADLQRRLDEQAKWLQQVQGGEGAGGVRSN